MWWLFWHRHIVIRCDVGLFQSGDDVFDGLVMIVLVSIGISRGNEKQVNRSPVPSEDCYS